MTGSEVGLQMSATWNISLAKKNQKDSLNTTTKPPQKVWPGASQIVPAQATIKETIKKGRTRTT